MKDIPEVVCEEFPDLKIQDYTITGVIGEGGQGVVLELEKDGVVYTGKVVHRNWSLTPWIDDLRGLRRGVELSEALDHESIQKVTEVIDEKEKRRFTVVKKYAEGRSLREVLDTERTIPVERLVDILDKTLDALAYLHDASKHPSVNAVFHRDIKPDHIIVRDDGHITLIDLDTAKPSGGRTTQYTAAGTAIYSAPESLLGMNDARSDLYSLGFVAVQALLGEIPEDLSDSRLSSRKAYKLPHSVPERVRTIIERMVLADPDARFQSAVAVREALGRCLEEKVEVTVNENSLQDLAKRRDLAQTSYDSNKHTFLASGLVTLMGMITFYGGTFETGAQHQFMEALGLFLSAVSLPVNVSSGLKTLFKRNDIRKIERDIARLKGKVQTPGVLTRVLRKMEGWESATDPGYGLVAGIALSDNNPSAHIETVRIAVHSQDEETRSLAIEMVGVYERDHDFSNSYPCRIGLTKVPGYSQLKRGQERRQALEVLCEARDVGTWQLRTADLHTIARYDPDLRVKVLAEEMAQCYERDRDFSRTAPFIRRVIDDYATTLFSMPLTRMDEHMYAVARDRYRAYIIERGLAPETSFFEPGADPHEHMHARLAFAEAFPEHPVYLAYRKREETQIFPVSGSEGEYDVEQVRHGVIMRPKVSEPGQGENVDPKKPVRTKRVTLF